MVCLTISSTKRSGTLLEAARERIQASVTSYDDRGCAGAMVFNACADHRSPPRCSRMSMAALERLWCSMAAMICVFRLVLTLS